MTVVRRLLSALARRLRSALGITALHRQADTLQAQLDRIAAAVAPPAPAPPDYVAYSLPGGLRYELSMPATGRDAFMQALAEGGTQDAPWRFLMDWVRPDEVFFDLGANLGSFSIPLAVRGAHVHAFELLYANLDHMAKSVARNRLSNMSLVLAALWDSPGAVGFAGYSAWGTVYGDTCTYVATLTLDDYVRSRQLARVDVMKIDIEGSEKQALRGAAQLLERDHPDIVIECNVLACGNNGYSYQELLALLAQRGYRFYRLHAGPMCWRWRIGCPLPCGTMRAWLRCLGNGLRWRNSPSSTTSGPAQRQCHGLRPESAGGAGQRDQAAVCKGRSMVKVQPLPGSSRAVSVPPSVSTFMRAMDRPRPRPLRSVPICTNGANKVSTSPCGNPPQWSRTSIRRRGPMA